MKRAWDKKERAIVWVGSMIQFEVLSLGEIQGIAVFAHEDANKFRKIYENRRKFIQVI